MAAAVPPDPDRLDRALREARDDAAPLALTAAGVLLVLALVSRHARWDLLGHRLWWLWLALAIPYVCLAATLLLGLRRLVRHDRRREIVIALLALGEEIGIDWTSAPFELEQFRMGMDVELEHGLQDLLTNVTHDHPAVTGRSRSPISMSSRTTTPGSPVWRKRPSGKLSSHRALGLERGRASGDRRGGRSPR